VKTIRPSEQRAYVGLSIRGTLPGPDHNVPDLERPAGMQSSWERSKRRAGVEQEGREYREDELRGRVQTGWHARDCGGVGYGGGGGDQRNHARQRSAYADIGNSQPTCIAAQYKTEGRHEDPRKTTVDADTRGARK
jgi:hypothetical protein